MSATNDEGRPFSDMLDNGFLWLINTTVFHPRGFAIGFFVDDDGNVTGWDLIGDGLERWAYVEEGWPEGKHPDDAFLASQEEFSKAAIKGFKVRLREVIDTTVVEVEKEMENEDRS